MTTFDPFNFVFMLWDKLSSLCTTLYEFLFYDFKVFQYTVSVWQLLGGAGLIALIVIAIVRG